MPNLWLRPWKWPRCTLLAVTVFTRTDSEMDVEWTTERWIVMNCWGTGSLLLLSPFPGHGEEVISCPQSLKREKHTGCLARLRWVAALVTISAAHLPEERAKPADLTLLEKCQSYCMCLAGPCCTPSGTGNSLLPSLSNMKSNAAHPVSNAGPISVC